MISTKPSPAAPTASVPKLRSVQEIQAKNARKRQRENRALILVIMFFGVVFSTVAALGILNWRDDNANTEQQIALAEENATLRETDINSELVEQKTDPAEDNIYWSFIKMNLLDVNLNRLKALNPETKGWVQVPGTNVNYPFVQTTNNDYYLKHSFDGSKNSAGWVFLDYRNNSNLTDKNNILYAHGRLDTTMFGGLRNIMNNGWLSDRANFAVRTSTEGRNAIWQVFSIYHLEATSDYLKTTFDTDEEFQKFLTKITRRSLYDFSSKPNVSDTILTLSTCFNDTERMVLHAKLIKYN